MKHSIGMLRSLYDGKILTWETTRQTQIRIKNNIYVFSNCSKKHDVLVYLKT